MVAAREFRVDPVTGLTEIVSDGMTLKTALSPIQLQAAGYRPYGGSPETALSGPAAPYEVAMGPANREEVNARNLAERQKAQAEELNRLDAPPSGGRFAQQNRANIESRRKEIEADTGGFRSDVPHERTSETTAAPPTPGATTGPVKLPGGGAEQEIPGTEGGPGTPGGGEEMFPNAGSGGPSRVIVSKGGMMPAEQRVEVGARNMSDEERRARGLPTEEELSDASIAANQAILAQGDAQRAANEAASAAKGREIRARQLADEADARRIEKAHKIIAEKRQKIDADRAAVDQLKVDPKHYIKDLGTFGTFVAAIGAIAGGIRAGLQGGPNHFLQMVQGAIDRDIQNQKDAIDLRRQGLAGEETALERLTQELGDPVLAEKELRLRQEGTFAAMAQKFAIDAHDKEIQASVAAALAEQNQKRLLQAAEINQAFGDKIVQSSRYVPGSVTVVGGGPRLPKSKEEWDLAEKIRQSQIRVRGKEATVRAGGDATVRSRVIEGLTARENFLNSLGRLLALAKQAHESGNPQLVSEVRQAMVPLKTNLGRMENVQTGQGAMSNAEQDLMKNTMGEIENLTSTDNISGAGVTKLQENFNLWESQFKTYAENWLLEPPQDVLDAKGYLYPKVFELPPAQIATPTEYSK